MHKLLLKVNATTRLMENLAQEARQIKLKADADIEKIKSEGKNENWTQAEIARIRKQASEDSHKLTGQLQEHYDCIAPYEKLLGSRPLMLASLPITKRGLDNLSPENPHLEAVARLQIMAEAQKLSVSELALFTEAAKTNGDFGRAYLYRLEHGTRTHKPGEPVIDLSGIEIPEMKASAELFTTARVSLNNAKLDALEASGTPPADLAVMRLTASRGGMI